MRLFQGNPGFGMVFGLISVVCFWKAAKGQQKRERQILKDGWHVVSIMHVPCIRQILHCLWSHGNTCWSMKCSIMFALLVILWMSHQKSCHKNAYSCTQTFGTFSRNIGYIDWRKDPSGDRACWNPKAMLRSRRKESRLFGGQVLSKGIVWHVDWCGVLSYLVVTTQKQSSSRLDLKQSKKYMQSINIPADCKPVLFFLKKTTEKASHRHSKNV